MVDFNDRNNLKSLILEYYNNYRQGGLNIDAKNINKYSRKSLTERMTELFTKLLTTT